MIIHNVGQRSADWFKLRLGKVTGSNAHKLTAPARFKTYYTELLAETITRHVTEGHISDAMQWGIDNEPFAAEWYQEQTQFDVAICGFVEVEGMSAGCSPDLVIGEKGMCQIKCPSPKNHIDYIMNGPDREIQCQMQWEMFCYNAEWNDFVSFDPRWPDALKGTIHRIKRDDAMIAELVKKAKEMETMIQEFCFDHGIKIERFVPSQRSKRLADEDYDNVSFT